MYIFRWYPETIVSSLRSSMNYMYVVYPHFRIRLASDICLDSYVDSDHWNSFHNFLIHNK